MDKGNSYRDIGIPETVYENYIEDRIEQDLTIPDYQASARKVVECSARAVILNKAVSSESVSLDGVCVWTLVYLSEEDELLHSLTCERPFSETFSGTGEGALRYRIKTQNVLCKLQSPQRAVCKASLCIALQIDGSRSKRLLAESADEQTQFLRQDAQILSSVFQGEKEFKVTGEVPIKKTGEFQVCREKSEILLREIEAGEDKLTLRGVCKNQVMLLSKERCEAECIESETPFTQMIDMPGVQNGCRAHVRCTVNETQSSILGEDKERSVLISSTVEAQAVVYCADEISLLSDAYHPVFELETQSEPVEFFEDLLYLNITQKMNEKIHLSTADISILYHHTECEIEKITAHDNMLILDGKLKVTFAYRQNDEIGCNEFSLPFQATKAVGGSFDKLKCEAQAFVEDFNYIILSDTEIEISCTVNTALSVFVLREAKALSDMSMTERRHDQILKTPLVLYYGTKGEQLWDIGKKYFVPISVLQENNELTEQILPEDTLLFISKH